MKTPLRLLLLEDDPIDADLITATLIGGRARLHHSPRRHTSGFCGRAQRQRD